jgi:hypothetical protein
LSFSITSSGLGEALLEILHHLQWNGLLARIGTWLSNLLDSFETSVFVEFEPTGNCVAMDPEMAGRSASALCLPGLQKKQHVIAALDLSVLLCANKLF